MVRLVTVCSMICVLEIKRCQTFRVLKGASYVVFFFKILIALMFLCTYIVLNASSCVTFSVIFANRAYIVCIDSGTHDTIRVSFALAIRFFDISINRYTPIHDGKMTWAYFPNNKGPVIYGPLMYSLIITL